MNPAKYDIHSISRRLKTALKLIDGDSNLIPENKKLILDFDKYILSLGLKPERRYKYLHQLRWLSKMLGKRFADATKEDMIRIVGGVEKENITEWSKVDRKVAIKRFYKWFKCNDDSYPDEVRWFRCRIKNDRCMLPEQLLNEEDVKKLSDAAIQPRDKALIQVLYESGCRISEILTIQIKNVSFDGAGALLRVTGKTGDRRVRIVASVPALAAWLERHPYKDEQDAYVWLRYLHRNAKDTYPLGYNSVRHLLIRLASDAGVKKRVNPHLFRHSRATSLANRLTEAQMKEFFGWVQGSDMAGVYVHLSGRDVDDAILKTYGKKAPEKTEQPKPNGFVCESCNTSNIAGSKFCNNCGKAFGNELWVEKVAPPKRQSNFMGQLMQDPDFRDLMLKKMAEAITNE
ncbi:MAG: site-specific integrase [Candidatus Micrarchaeota archaeon]